MVGENCELAYPSVLGIIRKSSAAENPFLSVNEGSTITGVLFAYQKSPSNRKQVKISIAEDAVIKGQVYSNGLVELRGSLHGSLMCNKFILNTPSSVYENHLLNSTIDYSQLSEHFVGINLVHRSESRKIVKWLF